MRRLRTAGEAIKDDPGITPADPNDKGSVILHWKFDDPASMQYNSYTSGSGTPGFRLRLVEGPSAVFGKNDALWNVGQTTASGSVVLRTAWFTAVSGFQSLSGRLSTSWSLSFWTVAGGTNTAAFFEYSALETVDANTLNRLGVYMDGDKRLSVRWDLSTSTTQVVDTSVVLSSRAEHVVVSQDMNGSSVGWLRIAKNGMPVFAATVFACVAASSLTSNWIINGSRRYGSSSGATPAFVSAASRQYDDVVLYDRALDEGKIRSIYADYVRPWDEAAMIRGGAYRTEHRVLVYDTISATTGSWVDLSSYRGRDWTVSADVKNAVEDQCKTASIRLRRRFSKNLDLSRLNSSASLTYGSYPLLDLRSRIRVECAVVPSEWRLQGWEWTPDFEGYVDSIDWGGDFVSVEARDPGVALEDVYRLDADRYEYAADAMAARDHIQALIDDNVPASPTLASPAGKKTWGYLGGTPVVYTPVPEAWSIRYDHSPAGNIRSLIQNVADQPGWDIRYRPYEPLDTPRLTFFQPPRDRTVVCNAKERSDGFTELMFTYPHGLQVGQTVTLSGSALGYNGGAKITNVLSWHRALTDQTPSGTPATEAVMLRFGPLITIPADAIRDVGKVSSQIDDIRNHIVVRFNRADSTATMFALEVNVVGNDLEVVFDPNGNDAAANLQRLSFATNQTMEATLSSPDAGFSGTRVISGASYTSVLLADKGAAAGTSTSAIFSSDYIGFNSRFAIDTPSVQRYGMRTAGVFEGSTEGVTTVSEADRLAAALLSDLANPTVDMAVTTKCMPWLDIYDVIALEEDPLGRWPAMDVAIVGCTHHYGDECYTSLELRHDRPSKGRTWTTSLTDNKWSIPGGIASNIGNDIPFVVDNRIGPMFMAQMSGPPRGKSSWLWDRTEVHLSTASSGFAVNPNTLVDSFRGSKAALSFGNSNASLSPGQRYYMSIRYKDRFGNFSERVTGASAGYVMRYLPQAPVSRVSLLSTSTVYFPVSRWSAYPFNDKTTSPAFDTYGNYTVASIGASLYTAQMVSVSSYAYVMPCTGDVRIEGKIALNQGDSSKSTAPVALGLFRRGSTLNSDGGSVPFIIPRVSPYSNLLVPIAVDGALGFLMGNGSVVTVQYTATATQEVNGASTLWLSFVEIISANSGDQILLAVRPDSAANKVMAWPRSATSTVSTSYLKFTVVSQDELR